MYSTILIIDKRKELSTKYKKSLEDSYTKVKITRTLKDAMTSIQSIEPDLIIVSDSIEENLVNFCQKVRALTYNSRPIIVALSKSADSKDKIEILNNGADDFWSEPVKIDEFKTRIHAHLRREYESNLDNTTLLPNRKIVYKILKKVLNSEVQSAILLVGVDNLENYKSVHSDIAAEKLVQTLIAIIKSTMEEQDFLGQIDDTNFIILTNSYRAEKMAAFLTFAFDTVTPKFYSLQDAKRGYTLLKGDREAEMRVNFVSCQIACITDNFEMINSTNTLIEKLFSLKKIAKIPNGSSYIVDRIKISGENSINPLEINKTVFIKENDEALQLLLRTTLELQGYNVIDSLSIESCEQPSILILDSNDDLTGLDFCKKIKNNKNFINTKIIVTTSVHDKSVILDSGADLYLPKPYEISDLIRWVEYFIDKL